VPPGSNASSAQDGTGSFRVSRPSDSERVRKATLMGMAISSPPPAPESRTLEASPPEAQPEARSEPPKKLATPPRGIPSGTLIGVVGPLEARVQRLASAAQDGHKLSDKRTMLGVPLKDLRIEAPQPQIRSTTDGPGMVTQAEVRAVAPTPVGAPPGERIGSTWQEIPGAPRAPGSAPPMAVLVEPATATANQRRVENDFAPRPSFDPRERASNYDRVSDIPTQMRDVATLDSRRPKRGIPLRYIGIVMLTAAAYLAWLYLLDHL
jgi:hypothetical protein